MFAYRVNDDGAWCADYDGRVFAIAGTYCHLMLMTKKAGTR